MDEQTVTRITEAKKKAEEAVGKAGLAHTRYLVAMQEAQEAQKKYAQAARGG